MKKVFIQDTLEALAGTLGPTPSGADKFVMMFDSHGSLAGKCSARGLIQDMATAGIGYGTCSTDATVGAKTVAIADFILLKNGIVSVLFTKANAVAGATLNINSTGAKPIRVNGVAVQPGLIKAQTVVQFQYDGTAWNIVGMFGLEQTQAPDDLYVDLGLPSGLKWAIADIDVTTESGFTEVDGQVSPFKYEKSFVSWGNTKMYNPNGTSFVGVHDFGTWDNSKNEAENGYLPDSIYGQTEGCKLTANMAPSQDAARANLGAPWRMPTTGEFKELFDNCDFIYANGEVIDATVTDKRVTVNGILGLYLKSKINGNTIFFACSGHGYGSSWSSGSNGYYWSASFYSACYARLLSFYRSGVNPQNIGYRYYGFAVRPVQ